VPGGVAAWPPHIQRRNAPKMTAASVTGNLFCWELLLAVNPFRMGAQLIEHRGQTML
jgi:hypothetical protein